MSVFKSRSGLRRRRRWMKNCGKACVSAQAVPEPPNGQPIRALEAFIAVVTRQQLKEERPVCGGVSSADGGCCSRPPGHNISKCCTIARQQVKFNHLVVLLSTFSPFAQSPMVFRRTEAEWLRAKRVCAGWNKNNPAMSAHLHQQSGCAWI